MIQRVLYTVLQNGIAAITADPTILERLFSRLWCLTKEEVTAIKTLFAAKPPIVVHGYARADHTFPLYAITLGTEQEDEHYMGDEIGIVEDPDDPDFGKDIAGSIWQHTFQILVYAEHPDATTYYYEIAKRIMLSATKAFSESGIFEIHLSGMDLAPDPRYIPEHLFVRQLTFTCKRELEAFTDAETVRAFQVSGLHVDSGLVPSDVTVDKATITVSTGS